RGADGRPRIARLHPASGVRARPPRMGGRRSEPGEIGIAVEGGAGMNTAPLDERLAVRGGLTVTFRDDDGGWADASLWPMFDVLARAGVVADIAVIPAATTPALSKSLRARIAQNQVRVHQHGFAHANHETEGRKCEFGPARARGAVRADLETGIRILDDHFG